MKEETVYHEIGYIVIDIGIDFYYYYHSFY